MEYAINIICLLSILLLILKLYVKVTTGICKSSVCVVGKTVIVTGANSGIGYQTALDLAKRGAKTILACRNPERGQNAAKQIIEETDNPNVIFKQLNLSSFKSVKEFAADIKKTESRLDILVNNAGIASANEHQTEDGLIEIMQANYFGHFLLTNLLLDLIKKTPNSRIINVSSVVSLFVMKPVVNDLNIYPKHYLKHFMMYAKSKLCQIYFTIELAKRLKGTTTTVYSLHPGLIKTEIFKDFYPIIRELWVIIVHIMFKDSFEGAQTTIYCSVAKGIEHLSGQHFHECHPVRRYFNVRNSNVTEQLWKISEELVNLNSGTV